MSGLTDDRKKLNAKLLSLIKDVSSVDKDVDTELETFLKDNANNQDLEKVLNLQRGGSKLTLLHVISSIDQKEECVKLLLQANANPKLKDYRGKTPLHYAIDKNIISSLRGEAELNEQDNEGKTSLDIAIENHNYDIEELLLTEEQKVLQESLYKAFGDVNKLKGLLKKYKKNKNFERILKLHDNEGKLKILQYVRNIPCEETKRLLSETVVTESSGREESSLKSRTLWDNLIAQQREKLETFLGRVSTAKGMNELRQVVKEAMVDGVRLNFAKKGSLYNKKYENKYGFADYVIRRINELKSNFKNREDIEIASNIVCCLVSKGAVLHNIYSKFVIDELEEFAGHKDNMKNASICYSNQDKKFMEVAKGATSGKVKDAKMDNSILYLEYSENSRVQVAKITD
ncbi:ankyrin repeat domain-containing protein [Wolbachia endosymbiont of Tettigetta isshikii]|uniref:ankyrin repeat domain-containing protein n=1 Tax=Wolbachia endosymbiont of Tettigetta isshikii TaxID=3239093 RepID=UPI00397ECF54